ncbi:1-phosphatidylinositol 3-phosphate 5-kinase-like [Argiope bruennichi]|uniref:1-phosphatidylinositol 3-phosphate 5-kinase-like n=1 Tax=Argiope bruennichi TaxID=94029 RepID=UPI002494CAEC|nr:1-phosphatidylinositol 3-phosphate 5-kinase-like [Argiope bruennichi]
MSVICQTFVQNTWRSDLCSNCFKCQAEHSGGRGDRITSTHRYMPQATALYQSRGISSTLKWRLSDPIYERVARRDFGSQTPPKQQVRIESDPPPNRGILIKTADKKQRNRPSVDFASEEAMVIGYGGNDYDSDQSPWEMGSDDESVDLDLLDDTDEDRKITRITRNNTEFNASKKLLESNNTAHNTKNNNNSSSTLQSNNNRNNSSSKTSSNNKNNENLSNSKNNSSPCKPTDKTLSNLTYNDIQQDKKLNQYYFSSMEPLKSYLHGSNVTKTHHDHLSDNNNSGNDGCRKLLNDSFSPLNTRTYSFVSEVSKHSNILSSEHSSDSDYSTCRLTAGDSTDSESFHDTEESRILPCSSFLHGNYPRPDLSSLESDKKYDGGSSTSGDVSNLSDDSDAVDLQERTPYRMRNVRIVTKMSSGDVKVSGKNSSTNSPTDTKGSGRNSLCETNGSGKSSPIEISKSGRNSFGDAQVTVKSSPTGINASDRNSFGDALVIVKNSYPDINVSVGNSSGNIMASGEVSPTDKQKTDKYSPKEMKKLNKTCSEDIKESEKDTSVDAKIQSTISSGGDIAPISSPHTTVEKKVANIQRNDQVIRENKETEKVTMSQNINTPVNQSNTIEKRSINSNDSNKLSELEHTSKLLNASTDSVNTSRSKNFAIESIPTPNPPVDVNLGNIIAVNASSSKQQVLSGPHRMTENKPPPPVRSSETSGSQQQLQISVMPSKINTDQMLCQSDIKATPTTNDEQQQQHSPKSSIKSDTLENYSQDIQNINRDGSDDEAINNRQSKLAALALELELARRDSAMRSANISRSEVKTKPINTSEENYPIIKKSATSALSRLVPNTVPDVLVQEDTPTKTKKNRFSLKKLLKRNKESGSFAPTGKEVNPKAWKKQSFDRNRLSLEIVHPMDLANDPMTSGDSTPTEEGHYMVSSHPGRGNYNRARSLSALPQLTGDMQDEDTNCSLLDCRKVDTLPTRKAGTVAERKKNRPSLVRTPSCSALPNRPTVTKDPPPKPPPPPKAKVMHPPPPPPPPHAPRISKPFSSPARPPPPKIPESRSRSGDSPKSEARDHSSADKEYANLGDIRSLITPKKPQRPSALSGSRGEIEDKKMEDIYETLKEEDHYTYLDEVKTEPASVKSARPWLDLQTSYVAIAAANYESLAEIISSSMNSGMELFQNGGKSLKWKDFSVESDAPLFVLPDKNIYNAIYRPQEKDVMLLVTPRKQSTPQNARNLNRYPVLASFTDNLPKSQISEPPSPYMEWASVYVLQRCTVTTVEHFAENTALQRGNQHVHLRNYCFVLLQLIHSLKSLQAEGIEEVSCDLSRLIVVDSQEDKPPVFVLFPEDKAHMTLCDNRKTLCQAVLSALYHFLRINQVGDLDSCEVNGERLAEPVAHTFKVIAEVLIEEKASSLSQAKGFLEYMLWGPVDVKVPDSQTDLDTVLQRWLDLQRAQMVKSTISQLHNTHLHVYEEYQLVFLLQASVKSLNSVISKL